MKFFLSNGKYFAERLQGLPFATEFASSKILVVCTDAAGRIAGVCGIRSLFNIAVLYVRKDYRGKGIGFQLLKKAIETAERQPPNFVTATIAANNAVIFHILCKLGFKQVLFLSKSHQILMVTSATRMGRLACAFLQGVRLLFSDKLISYVHFWLYTRTLSN